MSGPLSASTTLVAPQRVMLGWHAGRRRTTWLKTFCDAAAGAFLQEELADPARAA